MLKPPPIRPKRFGDSVLWSSRGNVQKLKIQKRNFLDKTDMSPGLGVWASGYEMAGVAECSCYKKEDWGWVYLNKCAFGNLELKRRVAQTGKKSP